MHRIPKFQYSSVVLLILKTTKVLYHYFPPSLLLYTDIHPGNNHIVIYKYLW